MAAKYKKRADGRYCTHVVIGVKDDGKPLRKTIYAHTIRELEERAAELRRQVTTGTIVTDSTVTVAEWAAEWLNTYKAGVAYNTHRMYRIVIYTHIIPYMGHVKLKDVRPHHIQGIINQKSSQGLTRAVEKISLTLKQIFKKAVENNLVVKNPTESVELPKRDKKRKRALTEEEKKYIESADLDLKSRAFLYIMLYAGLRKGEALALMRNDISLRTNTIQISKTLIHKGNRPEIKQSPKSKAGYRSILMPDILRVQIEKMLAETNTMYLFTSATGSIMSSKAFRCFWDKIINQLNIEAGGNAKLRVLSTDITPHLFRHSYATSLFYAGVDIKMAQYLLGHASANMTMEIYTHLDMSKSKTAIEKLNSFIACSQRVVNEQSNSQ